MLSGAVLGRSRVLASPTEIGNFSHSSAKTGHRIGKTHANHHKTAHRYPMTPLELFFVLIVLVVGILLIAYLLAVLSRGIVRRHRGEQPAWPRFHVRYYVFALLFIAFDMEMAFMYPWAVVFRDLGLFAYAEIGFFLTVLGLGILYAWREGALD